MKTISALLFIVMRLCLYYVFILTVSRKPSIWLANKLQQIPGLTKKFINYILSSIGELMRRIENAANRFNNCIRKLLGLPPAVRIIAGSAHIRAQGGQVSVTARVKRGDLHWATIRNSFTVF